MAPGTRWRVTNRLHGLPRAPRGAGIRSAGSALSSRFSALMLEADSADLAELRSLTRQRSQVVGREQSAVRSLDDLAIGAR